MTKRDPLTVLYTLCLLLLASLSLPVQAQQTIAAYIPNEWPDSRYTVHNNDTVTDTVTGLMWKRCSQGQSGSDCATGSADYSVTWKTALEEAASETFAGYSDWRLPNIQELRSLVALDRYYPAINTTAFPNAPLSIYYWSSSPHAAGSSSAWRVNFNEGNESYYPRGNYEHVRLVRDGQ